MQGCIANARNPPCGSKLRIGRTIEHLFQWVSTANPHRGIVRLLWSGGMGEVYLPGLPRDGVSSVGTFRIDHEPGDFVNLKNFPI
jgi:hypothetical protein